MMMLFLSEMISTKNAFQWSSSLIDTSILHRLGAVVWFRPATVSVP